jgi:excisionase family DNA binding protein
MRDTDHLPLEDETSTVVVPSARARVAESGFAARPRPLSRQPLRASTGSLPTPLIPKEAAASTDKRPPVLLTVPEVAELLRTTNKAIYAMVERGQLAGPVRRIRRRVLFDQAALVAWMSELSGAPSPEGDRR